MQATAQFMAGPGTIPARAGIGLRADHYEALLETLPAVGWLEVHSENYFGAGGAPLHYLGKARCHYPLSLHGVGLSIGSADPLNIRHLSSLKSLIDRIEPALVSDHLCWSSVNGRYLNDLLPMPFTMEALAHLRERISRVQDYLNRPLLIENLSSYLQYRVSDFPEAEFIAELARRSGCGILLDINNVYVSACNHGFDANAYIQSLPPALVQEFHLAGFTTKHYRAEGDDRCTLLIDSHDRRVAGPVWDLYGFTLQRIGRRPTLIEWDSDLPDLRTLVDEAGIADSMMEKGHALVA